MASTAAPETRTSCSNCVGNGGAASATVETESRTNNRRVTTTAILPRTQRSAPSKDDRKRKSEVKRGRSTGAGTCPLRPPPRRCPCLCPGSCPRNLRPAEGRRRCPPAAHTTLDMATALEPTSRPCVRFTCGTLVVGGRPAWSRSASISGADVGPPLHEPAHCLLGFGGAWL